MLEFPPPLLLPAAAPPLVATMVAACAAVVVAVTATCTGFATAFRERVAQARPRRARGIKIQRWWRRNREWWDSIGFTDSAAG